MSLYTVSKPRRPSEDFTATVTDLSVDRDGLVFNHAKVTVTVETEYVDHSIAGEHVVTIGTRTTDGYIILNHTLPSEETDGVSPDVLTKVEEAAAEYFENELRA